MPAFVYCTALAASMTMPPILRRIFSLSAGDGDSSMSFWWRRWIEHSRSPRWITDAVLVAEDLELDVARRLDVLLDVDVAHAERRFRLALRGLDRVRQLARRAHDPHAAAAAAGGRLDDDRIADLLGDLERLLLALDRAVAARQDRHAGLLHHPARPRLVAHQADHLRVGTDEPDVAGLADFREIGALRQEAVARVNRVGAGDLGRADHRRHVQVAVGAPRRADADVLVGKAAVQRVLVGLGEDRHRLDAELAAREDDAQRDFAAVRDQDLLEHLLRFVIANSRSPYCTGWPFST